MNAQAVPLRLALVGNSGLATGPHLRLIRGDG